MTALAELRETQFDPLFAGQALFRRVLEATARPGLVVPLGDVALAVPSPRLRPACALLLAILDREVSFHVVGPAAERVREYLRFNTGAHVVGQEAADFLLVTASGSRWQGARRGTLEAPHEGATVVCVPSRLGCPPEVADVTLGLQGPGISGEAQLSMQGLRADDLAPLWTRQEFPLGVDLWLAAADGHLAVIPRSTRCRAL